MKLRVIHVIHSSAFGGGPNMVTILAQQLHGQFDMEVVADGQGDMPARVIAAGVPAHRIPLTTKWSFSTHIPALASKLRSLKPDLVHLHGQFAGSLGQVAVQLAGRPRSLYTAQWPSYLDDTGPWSRFRNRTAERMSCGGATAVVCVSESDRREFLERRLCPAGKLGVINNAYSRDIGPSRAAFGGHQPPTVGFIGRLVDQKGVEYLVRAIPSVVKSHPDTRFLLVGDGPERPRLEAMARDLGVATSVDFAGYQPDPTSMMEKMDIVVVPSIYDPFPLVTVEAMVMARPIVGASVGGIPEAIEDGRTGELVPPRDPGAIASSIKNLLEHPMAAGAMGVAGRERATRRFSPEVIAGQYAELYRRLAARTSS